MLNPLLDKLDLFNQIFYFVLGTLTFPLLFYLTATFLQKSSIGTIFCEKFEINQHGIYDISNKITSTSFSLFSCFCGLFTIFRCGQDLMTESHPILENFLIFGISYFFYDLVSMYMVCSTETKKNVTLSSSEILDFLKKRPLIILHHIFVPLVLYNAMLFYRKGQGDCLLAFVFLMESSTPFVSMRVILCHLNMRESVIYVANGLAMLLTFFCCRILIFPFMYFWYGSSVGLSPWQTLNSVRWFCHAGVMALSLPQLFWFWKMLIGSSKIINQFLEKKKSKCT